MRQQILGQGTIPGQEANILEATPKNPNKDIPRDTRLEDIEFEGRVPRIPQDFRTVKVTGGMTDHIPSTRRFRGPNGLVAVFDSQDTPFIEVDYEYEWMNRHPGALSQILTRTEGELHTSEVGLWANILSSPTVEGGRFYKIEHWKPANIPATSPDSRFAEEREWMAFDAPVRVSRAFEGIVSLMTERGLSIRARSTLPEVEELLDAEDVVGDVFDNIDKEIRTRKPLYMMIFKGDDMPDKNFYDGSSIAFAYSRDGMIAPEDVPMKFRGNV